MNSPFRTLAPVIAALCHIGFVNGVGPKVTPTGTQSSSFQIVTPTFNFNNVSEMTTCTPAAINWMYSPNAITNPLQLALYITNAQVPQPPPPSSATVSATFPTPSASIPLNSTTQMIVSSTDPSLDAFTWTAVSVGAGWYRLTGIINLSDYDFMQQSNDFYVQNGTNVSCTTLTASPASSSADLAVSSTPTSTGTSTSPEPISGVPPSRHNDGAIAGGLVGGLVVAVAIITAYLRCRRKSPRKPAAGEWAVLSPVDSPSKTSPTVATNRCTHLKSDSVQPMVSSNDTNDVSIRPRIKEMRPSSSYTTASDTSGRSDLESAYPDAEGPFGDNSYPARSSSSSLTLRPAYPSGASQEILEAFGRFSPTNEPRFPERTANLGQQYNLIDPVLVSASLPRRSVHNEEDVFSDRFRV